MYYKLNDIYWEKHDKGEKAFAWRILYGLSRRLGKFTREPFLDGSWYKNNTIWRTICDLNLAVKYADTKGVLHTKPQRIIFNVCDMIMSGEGEGPLSPTPKQEGVIVCGEEIYEIDRFICKFFGFHEEYVPYIKYMFRQYDCDENVKIVAEGRLTTIDEFDFDKCCYIKAGSGWHGFLDSK